MEKPPNLVVQSDYTRGYENARAVAPELADNYIAHTVIGVPKADALMEEIKDLDRGESSRFIRAAMNDIDDPILRDAPSPLVKFIRGMEPPPHLVGFFEFTPEVRAFHRNSRLDLAGFVLSSIEGFTTNISRSFNPAGR